MSLRYFEFREQEYAILQWLDGHSSLDQIKDRFERRFAPRRITVDRLNSFVANLHRNGLAISDAPGQGDQLLQRHDRQQWSSWISSLASPLAIRFRGLDPERLLQWLYPKVRWIFSPWFFAACCVLIFAAVLLVTTNLGQFQSRLPEMNALVSPQNLIWLAIAMGMTKLIHELGHALTCKHYGGECHEMGVMLLVFTPCLYCNVTDAWKLSSRWQRIAISSAGIVVEIVLASICTILWWFSQPGLLNTIWLNVMVVCSVGTVFLNGNPLLRYDGYYIFSDAIDVPNLWQESRNRVRRFVSRCLMGFDPGNQISLQDRGSLTLWYGLASMAYRVIVLASILYLVYQVCKPLGLLLVAQAITLLLMVGICSAPLTALWRMMTDPAARITLRRKTNPLRVAISCSVALGIIAGCFLVPLPCRIKAPVLIEPRESRSVYVSVPGQLVDSVSAGESVKSGDRLARLENIEITRELENVRGELTGQQLRIRNLESLRGQNDAVAAQLPAAKEILKDLEQQLQQLEHDASSLTLTAPIDGTVLAPPSRLPSRPGMSSFGSQLVSWSGTPLDQQNLGATLERKTLYCLVGQPNEYEAVVYIDQSEIQFIREHQRVRLLLDLNSGHVIEGTIREISRVNVQSVPMELAVDQQLANQIDDTGLRRPEQTSYKAYVQIESTDLPLLIGARGRAKVSVQWQPLSQQIGRFLSQTFKPVI